MLRRTPKPAKLRRECSRDLDDVIVGHALIIHDKQLFIDDYVIADLQGVKKVLNRPVKHPA